MHETSISALDKEIQTKLGISFSPLLPLPFGLIRLVLCSRKITEQAKKGLVPWKGRSAQFLSTPGSVHAPNVVEGSGLEEGCLCENQSQNVLRMVQYKDGNDQPMRVIFF